MWWLNISPGKFLADLHLLLADDQNNQLTWLRMETNTISEPGKMFRIRQDTGAIDIEISCRQPTRMVDVKSGGIGYDFSKHIVSEWQMAGKDAALEETPYNSHDTANAMSAKVTVHFDQPWEGDQASWFAKSREDSKNLFGHLAGGGNLQSFLKENQSVGKVWAMSALHMAHQVLVELAYREPNSLVRSERGIRGGDPVFSGTRLPIVILFDCLNCNYTLAEFVNEFPTGDVDQSAKALALASEILAKEFTEREA